MFELIRPWILLFIVPAFAVLAWFFVRSLSDFPRQQRIASLALRMIIVLLLVLALAGLTWLHTTQEQYVMFLIDQSLSVGDSGSEAVDEFLKTAAKVQGGHQTAYLPFASRVGRIQNHPATMGSLTLVGAETGSKTDQ